MLMAMVVAIPLGLVAGSRPGSIWDGIARTLGLFGQSVPNFVLGMVLIVLIGVFLGWLPVAGRFDLEGRVDLKRMIMPALVLGLPTIAPLLLKALQSQDMYLAAGILMILSVLTVVGTLVSDILLAAVDPRIRQEY